MVMKKFIWYNAQSVEDALNEVNATVSETIQPNGPQDAAVFKAGGVDLLDLMKEGLANPGKIINIRNIEGLDTITYDSKKGLLIGANVTLSQIAEDKGIKETYPALHLAALEAGTPQIRNMATLGGNLAQRTRCWYFRSIDHECFRKGSGTCFARSGENEFHAIMENEDCTSVHASSLSTALLAFGAKVEIARNGEKRKEVEMKDFFVLPSKDSRKETILEAGDMITGVHIPAVSDKIRSHYIKHTIRESHDWPIADVAVVLEMSGSKCKSANLVLGAAAPVPFRSSEASELLAGSDLSESVIDQAAEASMKNATPVSHNAYKVPVFKTLVKRVVKELV
jgi:xanthine dehydrogenase YagS FAD-binding subunit